MKRAEECNVTFVLNKISSDNLLIEERVHRSIWKCCRKNDMLTPEVLCQMLADILKYCLTHRMDSYKIHLDRIKGVTLIRKISKRSNYSDMSITQIVALIWACLSVVHHFHIRVIPDKGYRSWYRKGQYQEAMIAYERVLMMLLPQLFTTVIKSLITFFNEAKIWDMETYVTNCIKKILLICKDSESVINHLLDIVETCESIEDARNILKIIQNLFMYIQWKEIDDYMMFRFLETYRRSTMNEEFESLKWGLESCLRFGFLGMPRSELVKAVSAMLAWVFAIDPGTPIEFGNLLEHAAGVNNEEPFAQNLTINFISTILDLLASSDQTFSLLGSRILFFLFDRQKNQSELLTAKIYFQNADSVLKIGHFDLNDKKFLQSFNNIMHNNLLTALMKHGQNQTSIEAIFASIAVLVVEVPCGFTAAAAVSFAMAAQEYVLSAPESLDEAGYKIHACVMYIMTLVCHVHQAKTFYEYVNKVLAFRAQAAPQLNPPLMNCYESHPLQISRTELYFEDWESRYGLYRCFIKNLSDDENIERNKLGKLLNSNRNVFSKLFTVFKKR